MTTIRDITSGSLRLLEQVGAGEQPTAEESADALYSLISMLESWSIDGNKVWTEAIDSLSVTQGVDSYTIGIGGVFNTALPTRINAATIEQTNSFSTDVEILSASEYASQENKFIQGRPYGVYYERGNPLGTLKFLDIPNSAYTFKMYSTKQLSTYSSLNDTFVGPIGLERALRYNLAIEIAPEYGKSPSREVSMIAIESKTSVESQIAVLDKNTSQVDDALLCRDGGYYNIWTNQ